MTSFRFLLHFLRIIAALGCLAAPITGLRAEQDKPDGVKSAGASPPAAEIRQFCANNAAIAGDARIAWQTTKLRELEAQINQRIAELEAKKAQAAEWLSKRDEALKKATDAVVAIYAQMKPDAAATHLAAMEDAMAAAIMVKLTPRAASAILNQMEPARASQLTSGMVSREEKKS